MTDSRFEVSVAARADIVQRLRQIEQEHGVRILLAVEAGSRAWGFASADSDYDVRFIYAHPTEWYLSIDSDKKRDVIECPIVHDLDINGWDVRKALRLFNQSNPSLMEWLHSPIRYQQDDAFVHAMWAMIPEVYSPMMGSRHYRSMAKRTFNQHLTGDLVCTKKYLYAVRAVLAARWVEQFDTPAPITLESLLPMLRPEEDDLLPLIPELVATKRSALESGSIPNPPKLRSFVFVETALYHASSISGDNKQAVDKLSGLFQATLKRLTFKSEMDETPPVGGCLVSSQGSVCSKP